MRQTFLITLPYRFWRKVFVSAPRCTNIGEFSGLVTKGFDNQAKALFYGYVD